jgi:hypothetical protein
MRILLTAAALVAICALALAQEETEPAPEDIDKLIKSLGAESWREREEAQKKLIAAGKAAGPALEAAAGSDDPEISRRANRILDEICYLPDEVQKSADSLYGKLKSRDRKERDEAFGKLIAMGGRVLIYLKRLLGIPSDRKVEIDISPKQSCVRKQQTVDYVVTVKNTGEKPVWIPASLRESGSYGAFGTTGQGQINWSRGSGVTEGSFPFLYLEPGKSIEFKKQYRPFGRYNCRHILRVTLPEAKGAQYTTPAGEKRLIPFDQSFSGIMAMAEILYLPELIEGEKGSQSGQLSASLKVKRTEIEEGKTISLHFSMHNNAKDSVKIAPSVHDNAWYILVTTGEKPEVCVEGLMLEQKARPSEDYTIEAGKSLNFDVTTGRTMETAGEYYLICGYTEMRASGDKVFRGEVVSNAVKITVKPRDEKNKGTKSEDF